VLITFPIVVSRVFWTRGLSVQLYRFFGVS